MCDVNRNITSAEDDVLIYFDQRGEFKPYKTLKFYIPFIFLSLSTQHFNPLNEILSDRNFTATLGPWVV